jgi:predicted phage gp36 major capsid-like protein
MEKDDSGSLFDKAAEIERKRRLLKKKKKRAEEHSAPRSSASATAQPQKTDEFSEMFQRMREMRDDLEGQMLDLYSKVGVSRAIAEEFFSNSENIPASQKSSIDNDISKLEAQMTKILGVRVKKATQHIREAKETDKRKQKSIGQRRKWIQM